MSPVFLQCRERGISGIGELDAFRLALTAWRAACERRYGLLTRGIYGGPSHFQRDAVRCRMLESGGPGNVSTPVRCNYVFNPAGAP